MGLFRFEDAEAFTFNKGLVKSIGSTLQNVPGVSMEQIAKDEWLFPVDDV
jgi:hypothetical protein